MNKNLRTLTGLDRVIHEPARLMLVMILATVESADFLFLQRETGLTKGNLSAHLTKLESAGYVKIEKMFKGKYPLTLCKLTPAGIKALDGYRHQLDKALKSRGRG
ncbi:MAG: transcriptional regulator [Anaerolineales bacterium]